MDQRKVCPRCKNLAHLIGSRYYCHCGWSQKRETLETNQHKHEPSFAEAHLILSQRR